VIAYSIFVVWFFIVSFCTFAFWLQPVGLRHIKYLSTKQAWLGAMYTVLFFANCFVLGVFISIYQLKGNV